MPNWIVLENIRMKKFEDSKLQEETISYINLLNDHIEICDYIPVDYYGKYLEEFQPIYDGRSKIIQDMADNYGLTVSDKFQSNLDEFKTNSKARSRKGCTRASNRFYAF